MTEDVLDDSNFSSGMAAFDEKNFARAMQFLYPIAEAGDPEAQHRVAIMCQNGLGIVRNETRAFQMMKAAAEQDFPIAQHGLGFMYLEGDCVEQDRRTPKKPGGCMPRQALNSEPQGDVSVRI
jgi:TPR repeat protein